MLLGCRIRSQISHDMTAGFKLFTVLRKALRIKGGKVIFATQAAHATTA